MASINISDLYSAVEDSRLNAFQSAKNESLTRLQGNLNQIRSTYRSGVTSAQTASRISALGQEEKLAAAGLSSGSAYAAPTSGYTETSRVASNNNLRTNLNNLSTTRMQQEQSAQSDSSSEIARAEQEYSNSLADIRLQSAQSTINQYNADRNAQMQQANADREQANADREYQYKTRVTAYEQAMARWQTYGIVLPADASVLGVAAGTRTASSSYNNAKLALDRWKALLG